MNLRKLTLKYGRNVGVVIPACMCVRSAITQCMYAFVSLQDMDLRELTLQ
jgi:hypothetical protein